MARRRIGFSGGLLLAFAISGPAHAQSILGYHGNPERSGNFIVPALSWDRAASLHLDPSFHPQFPVTFMPSRSIGSRRAQARPC
jgi:hypothetical protein